MPNMLCTVLIKSNAWDKLTRNRPGKTNLIGPRVAIRKANSRSRGGCVCFPRQASDSSGHFGSAFEGYSARPTLALSYGPLGLDPGLRSFPVVRLMRSA